MSEGSGRGADYLKAIQKSLLRPLIERSQMQTDNVQQVDTTSRKENSMPE